MIQARVPNPNQLTAKDRPAFYGRQLLSVEGAGFWHSQWLPVLCGGHSTVADPQLYEPKCVPRNRSEEVVCDKKIICQNCNNKEGLVGSLMV